MKKPDYLIDTNIFLDFFLRREPFYPFSRHVLELCEQKKINGYLTASSFTDIFYILNRALHDKDAVYSCLGAVLDLVGVLPVTGEDVIRAYTSRAKDFEDCLMAECAKASGCDAVVTRNVKDFENQGIDIIEPSMIGED